MDKLTVIGTITMDKLYFNKGTVDLLGGAPWFAIEISKKLHINLQLCTNIGEDFQLADLPESIISSSQINKVKGKNTRIEIHMDENKLPAVVKSFTGKIRNINKLKPGKVVVISTLFGEVDIKSIKECRKKFDIVILDIQGFTRPTFIKNVRLSDDIKKHPKNLEEICRNIDVLKLNESEFKALFRKGVSSTERFKRIHRLGVKSIILTKGKKGCILSSEGKIEEFSIKKTHVRNFLGAGDKFLILIGRFLLKGYSLRRSIQMGQKGLDRLME